MKKEYKFIDKIKKKNKIIVKKENDVKTLRDK